MMVIAAHLDISSFSGIHMSTFFSKSCCKYSLPKNEEKNMVQNYNFIVFLIMQLSTNTYLYSNHKTQYKFTMFPNSKSAKK